MLGIQLLSSLIVMLCHVSGHPESADRCSHTSDGLSLELTACHVSDPFPLNAGRVVRVQQMVKNGSDIGRPRKESPRVG